MATMHLEEENHEEPVFLEGVGKIGQIPEKCFKKKVIDKIAQNLSKISLNIENSQDQPKSSQPDNLRSESKPIPFKFSLEDVIPKEEEEKGVETLEAENLGYAEDDQNNRPEFIEPDNGVDFRRESEEGLDVPQSSGKKQIIPDDKTKALVLLILALNSLRLG